MNNKGSSACAHALRSPCTKSDDVICLFSMEGTQKQNKEAMWVGCNMGGAIWVGCKMGGAQCGGCIMGRCIMGCAIWVGCNMGGAKIQDGSTHDVDFSPILACAPFCTAIKLVLYGLCKNSNAE